MQYSRIATTAFFAALVLLGFALYKNYGLAWDEPISHHNGEVTLAYLLSGDPTLWTYSERYYGVAYELPFALLQHMWKLPTQDLFFIRHLATFLFFTGGVYIFYRLCLWRWKSPWFALCAAGCLVLSPRIFADAFYNSKDIPALVLFIVVMYTMAKFLEQPNVARTLTHAFASAALIAVRLPGMLVPVLTILTAMLSVAVAERSPKKKRRRMLLCLSWYVSVTAVFTVLLWPFLWQDPIAHFREAFIDMSSFSRAANEKVLYFGEFRKASDLPWHYVPVWIAITTPLLYHVLFIIGTFSTIKRFLLNLRSECRHHSFDLAIMGWFFGPIVAIIVFQSVVYDGWRHLYFIYPALIYIALLGAEAVARSARALSGMSRRGTFMAISITLALHLVTVTSFMIRNHPYQNVYFNLLVGNMASARKNFDVDYWGLSFREGLEYIAQTDKSDVIPVHFQGGSIDNPWILPEEEKKRFRVLGAKKLSDAKYILSNYRWQVYDKLPFDWEIYSVKVDNERIMSVFMVPWWSEVSFHRRSTVQ